MATIETTRPRNVNYIRAAGILYGDLGTSKAYVLGLAFALAGHASFWFILAISFLTLLVGINYILICKFYPDGGGVYASVRHRSKILSFIGAFFLIADYIVTAALSALSAFYYLDVSHPQIYACVAIFFIGLLNFLGPKRTGSLSVLLAIPTVFCILSLGFLSIPFLPEAVAHLEMPTGSLYDNWQVFVGIIVALSGIEAIANTTGSMKLDRGSSHKRPSVLKTSTRAILMVVLEVSLFTALLGLAMNALTDLKVVAETVISSSGSNVRDSMLRYMGEVFAGNLFGETTGNIFGVVISIVVSLILFSAVNTSIIALSSLLYVISKDNELPNIFQKLNRFGVPIYGLVLAFIIPVIVLLFIHDVVGLAGLYAIGFVGAIAVNLGSTSTNFNLSMSYFERSIMFISFLIMTLIEFTLFVDKPEARFFVLLIMTFGLILRFITRRKEMKVVPASIEDLQPIKEYENEHWLVAVTGLGKSLDFAIKEAFIHNAPLYILFLREQKVIAENDLKREWFDDPGAKDVFEYLVLKRPSNPIEFLYTVTADIAHSIAEVANEKKVKHLVIGRAKKWSYIFSVLRGTSVRDVSNKISTDVNLIVIY